MEYVERFRDITYPGVKTGTYLVGDCGTIINKRRGTSLTQKTDKDGYPILSLYTDDGGRTTYRVHRLVAWEFCDGYDEKSGRVIVNHKDCDTSYPYYENLEWCTYSENSKYSFKYGRTGIRGESSNFAKYKETQIRDACKLLELGYDRGLVSRDTGIDRNYLPDIISGKKWGHITCEYNLPKQRKIVFKGFPVELKYEIISLLRIGKRPKEICSILGLTYNKIHKSAITNLRKKL